MDDGTAAVIEQPEVAAVETPEIETPAVETPETPTPQTETPQTPETKEPPRTDGRTLPKDLQAVTKNLKADPATAPVAKRILDNHFFRERFNTEFPKGLDEALGLKAEIATLGGKEGIEALRGSTETLERLDADIASGSPEVINDFASSSPEGFAKLAPHYLDKLQQVNPEAYSKALLPRFYSSLTASGLPDTLDRAMYWLENGEVQKGMALIKSAQEWNRQLGQTLQQEKQAQTTPEFEQTRKEREEVQRERQEIFLERVSSTTQAHLSSTVAKELDSLFEPFKGLDIADKRAVAKDVLDAINSLLEADPDYKKNVAAMRLKLDKQKLPAYINAKIDSIRHRAVMQVWPAWERRLRGMSAPPAGKTAGSGQQPPKKEPAAAAPSGWITLPEAPKDADFAPGTDILMAKMTHQGKLANGRMARWPRKQRV